MDTDGSVEEKKPSSQFVTVSPFLKDDVCELVASLGGTYTIQKAIGKYRLKDGTKKSCKPYYRVRIWLPFAPFHLQRKVDRWQAPKKMQRVILSIEPVGVKDCVCITVDHEDGTFLCTKDLIVTHNSSANIMKFITWATEPELWPKLWPHRRPRQFWSLMPTKDLITTEFNTKWVPEFLPSGNLKNHPQYGWDAEIRNRHLWALHFKTGISIYTHTYEQDVHHLQAGTVDALFVDEEPPWELMPELLMRIANTNGYFNAVMTPTRGQDQWHRVFEMKGEQEMFQDALKQNVSMYDCLRYEDGSPSAWTEERINKIRNTLGSDEEIQLRVFGRFVKRQGLKLSAFNRELNVGPVTPMPDDWYLYSGVDIGTGGSAHPPAICFVAVSPDFKQARVKQMWRGSTERDYTSGDILTEYVAMRNGRSMAGEYYDHAAKDFGLIASRAGIAFQPAEKSHEIGFPLLNTLFKNQMLTIETCDNHDKFIEETNLLRHDSAKNHAADDLIDALRYTVSKIGFNFDGIAQDRVITVHKDIPSVDEVRRTRFETKAHQEESLDAEISFWNDQGGIEYDW